MKIEEVKTGEIAHVDISYEKLLCFFENDTDCLMNDTTFYFDDDDEGIHYFGCQKGYENPYWVGYCDIPDGCDFLTARELFEAKIFNHQSIKDRWEHLVFVNIGAIQAQEWLELYWH